ncbi:MAG: hypothetical protein P8163_06545 [Candidatus Thiodiazotropha sp.]
MFRKYKLAAAMLAAVATGAQAVHVNPDGTGQVLIYPYYNVNNNFQTNIHVVNTQNVYKIIKIRFRESGNSQDVLDFNIYMSPYDVWTGVVRNVGGNANVFTDDKSCTMPMYDQLTSVGTLGVDGLNMKTAYADVDAADAREGYIEVIEVGNIPDDLIADMNSNGLVSDAADVVVNTGLDHGSTRVPANCDVVTMGWTTGAGVGTLAVAATASPDNWKGNADDAADSNGRGPYNDGNRNVANDPYLNPPSGGLYGHVIYLNMSDGSAFVNEATAIDNYSAEAQHWLPNDADHFLLPSLASGSVNTSVEGSAGGGVMATSAAWGYTVDATMNDGNVQTPASGTNPWPISHVLMATGLMNDYFIDPTYDGVTDWVITFPMRKHGVYNGEFTNDCSGDNAVTAGAVALTTAATEGTDTCFLNQDHHVVYTQVAYDREEFVPSNPDVFEPSPVIDEVSALGVLPREVNVLQLGTEGVLGSDNAAALGGLAAIGNAGWLTVNFGGGTTTYDTNDASLYTSQAATNGASFIATNVTGVAEAALTTVPPGGVVEDGVGSISATGVPVIGFAAQRGNAPTIPEGSNFGETINHRPVRGSYGVN